MSAGIHDLMSFQIPLICFLTDLIFIIVIVKKPGDYIYWGLPG